MSYVGRETVLRSRLARKQNDDDGVNSLVRLKWSRFVVNNLMDGFEIKSRSYWMQSTAQQSNWYVCQEIYSFLVLLIGKHAASKSYFVWFSFQFLWYLKLYVKKKLKSRIIGVIKIKVCFFMHNNSDNYYYVY